MWYRGYMAKPTYDCAAHHIVPSGDNRFQSATNARNLLTNEFHIDINDAMNGVFLPTTANHGTSATLHTTLHSETYYQKVYDTLSVAKNQEQALNILGNIRSQLLNGTF